MSGFYTMGKTAHKLEWYKQTINTVCINIYLYSQRGAEL